MPVTSHPKIAAVVVLYNPDSEIFAAVNSYRGQVDILFAVDNSDNWNDEVVAGLAHGEKVVYLPNGANLGVARALNIGAEKAIEAGYDFLLTMDQDSRAAPDMVERLFECLAGEYGGHVGMISPFHVTKAGKRPPAETCTEVMTPMTSGCLLNLAAWRVVGPFRDELFIDFVDNEYCLRLRKKGFRVVQANRALLEHSVGDIRKYGPFIATHHSPLRRYYKTRNRFYVFREYVRDFPGHCLFDLVRLGKEIASIILFEGKKGAKLRMMWRGYRDYRAGRFGRYEG